MVFGNINCLGYQKTTKKSYANNFVFSHKTRKAAKTWADKFIKNQRISGEQWEHYKEIRLKFI